MIECHFSREDYTYPYFFENSHWKCNYFLLFYIAQETVYAVFSVCHRTRFIFTSIIQTYQASLGFNYYTSSSTHLLFYRRLAFLLKPQNIGQEY